MSRLDLVSRSKAIALCLVVLLLLQSASPAEATGIPDALTPYISAAKRAVVFGREEGRAVVDVVASAAARTRDTVLAVLPPSFQAATADLFSGAQGVLMAGQTHAPAAAGYRTEPLPAVGKPGQQEAVRTHTSSKFFYAIGQTAMELLLLRLFYSEPHGNRRRNHRVLALCSSPAGFALLVSVLAVPNGVAPVAVLTVVLLRLSDAIYVPMIFLANYVRPYAVAALTTCPCAAALVGKAAALRNVVASWTSHGNGGVAREAQGSLGTLVETMVWWCVLGAILFLTVARRNSGGGEDEDFYLSEEEDGNVNVPTPSKAGRASTGRKSKSRASVKRG